MVQKKPPKAISTRSLNKQQNNHFHCKSAHINARKFDVLCSANYKAKSTDFLKTKLSNLQSVFAKMRCCSLKGSGFVIRWRCAHLLSLIDRVFQREDLFISQPYPRLTMPLVSLIMLTYTCSWFSYSLWKINVSMFLIKTFFKLQHCLTSVVSTSHL